MLYFYTISSCFCYLNVLFQQFGFIFFREKNEERALVIQIRLMMLLNEHIWLKLDEEDYCTAAQLYLLVQHIFTGFTLENVDISRRLPIILRVKHTTQSLKWRILKNVKRKIQEVALTSNVSVLFKYYQVLIAFCTFLTYFRK